MPQNLFGNIDTTCFELKQNYPLILSILEVKSPFLLEQPSETLLKFPLYDFNDYDDNLLHPQIPSPDSFVLMLRFCEFESDKI